MNWSERRRVALRYTFAYGQGHLSSFLSSLSMLGLVLAIALLIVVLSVMNRMYWPFQSGPVAYEEPLLAPAVNESSR